MHAPIHHFHVGLPLPDIAHQISDAGHGAVVAPLGRPRPGQDVADAGAITHHAPILPRAGLPAIVMMAAMIGVAARLETMRHAPERDRRPVPDSHQVEARTGRLAVGARLVVVDCHLRSNPRLTYRLTIHHTGLIGSDPYLGIFLAIEYKCLVGAGA